jgi:hypothetical protein
MSEWRTDFENLPDYPAEFLVWHAGKNGYACVTVKGSGEFDYDQKPSISHWMPLPSPPGEGV